MKVVLLHDWLTGFRGGERVLEAFCELFPDAPIYTLIHAPGSTSPLIESKEIITSELNRIPGIHENYRKFLPLMPLAAERLRIRHNADVVLSSSHCVIKGVHKPIGSRHISYIHSPMRYIYDQFDNYFGHTSLPTKIAAHVIRPYLRLWDRDSNRNVDKFIANSTFVAERIRLFYGKEAEVINPFVDLADFAGAQRNPSSREDFYLMVSAFAPNKRIDLAIDAFNSLGDKYRLKIVGSGSSDETSKLRARAKDNIEFLGNLERHQIVGLFSRAKAFIFPGIEDFGITPLESLAAGTPVIAYRAAGVLDTLTPDTAQFFNEQSPEALKLAIQDFETTHFQMENLKNRARQFSKESFKEKILGTL